MKQLLMVAVVAMTILGLGLASPAYSQIAVNGLVDSTSEVCFVTIKGTSFEGEVTKNSSKLLKCEANVPDTIPRHDRSPQEGDLFSCTNGEDQTLKWHIHVNGQGIAKLSCHF